MHVAAVLAGTYINEQCGEHLYKGKATRLGTREEVLTAPEAPKYYHEKAREVSVQYAELEIKLKDRVQKSRVTDQNQALAWQKDLGTKHTSFESIRWCEQHVR